MCTPTLTVVLTLVPNPTLFGMAVHRELPDVQGTGHRQVVHHRPANLKLRDLGRARALCVVWC